jgi:hypothetical protein
MDKFKPFADSEASLAVGDLTVENGQDRIAIYGNLDLARDKVGLESARRLKALFTDIVRVLEAAPDLPDALPPAPTPQKIGADDHGLGLPTGGLLKGA